MSLINDALKRASQAERDRPRQTLLPGLMQPARASGRSRVPAVTAVVVVILLGTAGWLVHVSFAGRSAPATAPVPRVMVAQPAVSTTASLPASAHAPAPGGVGAPAVAPARPAVAHTPLPDPPRPAPVPVAAGPFPNLKLQGILYNSKNPKIIINGETRGENQTIAGALIVKIQASKVTVRWNGQSKDLYLESQ